MDIMSPEAIDAVMQDLMGRRGFVLLWQLENGEIRIANQCESYAQRNPDGIWVTDCVFLNNDWSPERDTICLARFDEQGTVYWGKNCDHSQKMTYVEKRTAIVPGTGVHAD